MVSNSFFLIKKQSLHTPKNMFPIACYQATGQYFAHLASNDRFPAILNAQNPAIPSAHPHVLQYIRSCNQLPLSRSITHSLYVEKFYHNIPFVNMFLLE